MDCCAIYMCEEIVIEILSRLPAKSLLRFMAVCRMWKSIITSPQFRLLSQQGPSTKLLVHTARQCYSLVENGYQNRLMFETDFPSKHYSFDWAEVIGSDNGLVCMKISCNRFIIWNPSIKKHVAIPNNPDMCNNKTYDCGDGFGGTTSGRDYKYVKVVEIDSGNGRGEKRRKKAVDIYSLKAGTWRRKYLDWGTTTDRVWSFFSSPALLRGRLHWAGISTNQIFSFDLDDEVCEDIIKVPESIQSNIVAINVTVIEESLAAIVNEFRLGLQYPSVWVMEEYGDVNSWKKLFNIDISFENLYKRVVHDTVHVLKNGDLLLGLVETDRYPSNLKLVTYNPETMKTMEFGGGGSFSSLLQVCGLTNYYKESLVLLSDDYRAVPDQPTPQCRQNPARTGRACSYPLARNLPMLFQPNTYLQGRHHGYYPVWTGGDSFHFDTTLDYKSHK